MSTKPHDQPLDNAPSGRGKLSRKRILRTALTIVDQEGVNSFTVRKLASRLGVTPMAIYRHYENKAAIAHELVDLVVGDYDVTNHEEADWIEWVCATFFQMRRALCACPGIIPLLDSATNQGHNAMAVMEEVLGRFHNAQLEPAAAAQLFHTLMAYTIGSVVLMNEGYRLQAAGAPVDSEEQLRIQRLNYEIAPRGEYPNIVELAPHLAHISGDEQFLLSIRQISKSASALQ